MPKKNQVGTIAASRKKKLPEYKTLRLTGKIKADNVHKISSMRVLWRDTWLFLWKHKVKMIGFVAVYAVAYVVLVKGLSEFTLDAEALKFELREALTGNIGAVIAFVSLYISLLSSITAVSNESANYYQSFILITASLAFIWLIRKLHMRNSTATVKDAFYEGMRPLFPFIIVLLTLALELLPVIIGSLIFVAAQSSAVAGSSAGVIATTVLAILGTIMTVYLLSGSIFALYIVTLPGATPFGAVRSSMKLLRIHRWIVLRKVVLFFALLILLGFFLVLPFIIWIPRYAEIAFFVMGCGSFAVMHTFLFKLYRSMLR